MLVAAGGGVTDNPHSDLPGRYWRLLEQPDGIGHIHLSWALIQGVVSPGWRLARKAL